MLNIHLHRLCLVLLVVVAWSLPNQLQAQRMVFVPSSGPNVGVLQDSIFGDTLITGERIDTNTTYVLQRGGFYLLNGTIENRFPLTIVAADTGTGDRPVLQPNSDMGSSSRAFRPRADLTLKGLYVTNADNGGGLNTRIIRVSGGDKIVIDDCHLDKDGQSAFRIDVSDVSLFISNSIISNIGQTTDPNNGRVIDDRGNPMDSVWMENNTFYNVTSTVLRDDGGITNYLWFNHNTVVNTGQRALEAGPVKEMRLTNNLFYNAGFLGFTPSQADDRQIIQIDSIPADSNGMLTPQVIDIRNNNFYLDSTNTVDVYPDSVNATPIFNADGMTFLDAQGSAGTLIEEMVTFDSMPGPVDQVVIATYDTTMTAPAMDDGGGDPFNQLTFDFHYATSASETGSTAGQPLGDLNWWGVDVISALEDDLLEETAQLNNYPNPFKEQTTIAYTLEKSAYVQLRVFSSTGQLVDVPTEGNQLSGEYTLEWKPVRLPAGVYFLQLRVNEATTTHRMLIQR